MTLNCTYKNKCQITGMKMEPYEKTQLVRATGGGDDWGTSFHMISGLQVRVWPALHGLPLPLLMKLDSHSFLQITSFTSQIFTSG